MRSRIVLFLLLAVPATHAAPKPHVVAFGKSQTMKCFLDADEEKPLDLKIRPLYVDTRLREFTTGSAHEITEHLFVIRRAYRVNDALPAEEGKSARWRWQLGGWLQVDRSTGRITALNLPEFDPVYSAASWYRDYAAYCGVSDDGKKLTAIVMQLGRRKPVLKKALGEASAEAAVDANCDAPTWERQPTRVTFRPAREDDVTYSVHGHSADLLEEEATEEGSE